MEGIVDMEEILKELLSEVRSLKDGQTQIIKRLDNLESRHTALANAVDKMETKIDERFTKIDEHFATLDTKVDNLQGQLQENTTILRALEHRSQVQGAETEGLKLGTATKAAVERIETKLDLLNTRLFQQETELQLIRRAK